MSTHHLFPSPLNIFMFLRLIINTSSSHVWFARVVVCEAVWLASFSWRLSSFRPGLVIFIRREIGPTINGLRISVVPLHPRLVSYHLSALKRFYCNLTTTGINHGYRVFIESASHFCGTVSLHNSQGSHKVLKLGTYKLRTIIRFECGEFDSLRK